ncbi:MAG TPA: HEAT repeat domain-containing protein [Gemmataceae bacterium]|nr:HEAT repeat domain-containing protein [Gemmataceae bacterium]
MSLGSSANGVYLEILKEKDAGSLEITRIFSLVARQKGDRTEFLVLVLKTLSHKEAGVRFGAANLLGEIGSADHASAIVPLLSDEESIVQSHAAHAIAKIGTAKELEAFERRLSVRHTADNPDLLDDLKGCRERLKKRLEDAKKKE